MMVVSGFNDNDNPCGSFCNISQRKGEKRRDERENRNRDEREETEEVQTFPLPLDVPGFKDSKPCPTVSQYQLDPKVMYHTGHLRHT